MNIEYKNNLVYEVDYKYGLENILEIPDGSIGFIYRTYNPLLDVWYIGKKHLFKKRKDKKTNKYVISESDWKKYYGSNDFIRADIKLNGTENWYREIICWCDSEIKLTYSELKYQIKYDWEQDNCLNNNLLGKIYKTKIK